MPLSKIQCILQMEESVDEMKSHIDDVPNDGNHGATNGTINPPKT